MCSKNKFILNILLWLTLNSLAEALFNSKPCDVTTSFLAAAIQNATQHILLNSNLRFEGLQLRIDTVAEKLQRFEDENFILKATESIHLNDKSRIIAEDFDWNSKKLPDLEVERNKNEKCAGAGGGGGGKRYHRLYHAIQQLQRNQIDFSEDVANNFNELNRVAYNLERKLNDWGKNTAETKEP